MQIYEVGGAVRDRLMGLEPKDRDYVVVGATVAQMLAAGFTQVGADFPVFLHPETNDEYALARTERKAGIGYHGFVVNTEDVSLEDDLLRRDLTINAIARDASGVILDPHGGRKDLEARVLRHVSPAFAEDPLRVLRVARFAARFGPTWTIAPETLTLMAEMVARGELDALVPERIWKEMSRGLMEAWPLLMVRVLQLLNVFSRPVMVDYSGVRFGYTSAMQDAADAGDDLAVRFALSFPRSWTREQALASRVPAQVREVSELALALRGMNVPGFAAAGAEEKMALIERLDALRQPLRANLVLRVLEHTEVCGVASLRAAIERARAVDVKAITHGMPPGPHVGQAIRHARLAALVQR